MVEQIDPASVLYMQSEGFCEQLIVASSVFQHLCMLQYTCCMVVVGVDCWSRVRSAFQRLCRLQYTRCAVVVS